LREATEQGWRALTWFYLDHDPNLELLRAEPEFQRLRQLIHDDLEAQASRTEQLRASGDLKL
jgi:hypothetical protein